MLPRLSRAIPIGLENSPSPVPGPPIVFLWSPVWFRTWIMLFPVSLTKIWVSLTAIPLGRLNRPAPTPNPPNVALVPNSDPPISVDDFKNNFTPVPKDVVCTPDGEKICIRLLNVSATKIWVTLFAMALGWLNSPSPLPAVPSPPNAPSFKTRCCVWLNIWIRLLLVSATKIWVSFTEIPAGWSNSPVPFPAVPSPPNAPSLRTNLLSLSNIWIRLLLVSATKIFVELTATSLGWSNWPLFNPTVPNFCSKIPEESNTFTSPSCSSTT